MKTLQQFIIGATFFALFDIAHIHFFGLLFSHTFSRWRDAKKAMCVLAIVMVGTAVIGITFVLRSYRDIIAPYNHPVTNPITYCTSCGSRNIDSEYCRKCGEKLILIKTKLKNTFVCVNCNTPNDNTCKFCSNCSHDLENMKFKECQRCKTKNRLENKYCNNCGKQFAGKE